MRIAVFTKTLETPAYEAARLGADRVGARFAARITHHVPRRPDDADEQGALLDAALAERPDAIVIATVHASRIDRALLGLGRAGIPIHGFVSRSTAVPCVSFVGADDVALGRRLAAFLCARLDGRGRVAIVGGPADAATSRARLAGIEAALAEHPGISVVARLDGAYRRETARGAFAAWHERGDGFDAVLAANDVMALGVIDVLGARTRVPIVGINAIPQAIDAIAAGSLLASADFNAMGMSALATECAIRHLRGEAVPSELMLPVEIVDRHNHSRWAMPYAERALPTLEDVWR